MPLQTQDEAQSSVAPVSNLRGDSAELLVRARAKGRALNLPFSGALSPEEAWSLFQRGEGILIDVRTFEERKFVGHVPESRHVAWQLGAALIKNPRFVRELEQKASKDEILILLCRSGKRSAAAAEAAVKAGFLNVFNVLEGFEGERDESQHRGEAGGWRRRGLPWVQD